MNAVNLGPAIVTPTAKVGGWRSAAAGPSPRRSYGIGVNRSVDFNGVVRSGLFTAPLGQYDVRVLENHARDERRAGETGDGADLQFRATGFLGSAVGVPDDAAENA